MNYQGLNELEAQKIYIENGPNEIKITQKSFFLNSIIKSLYEPMMLILLLACFLYLFIGQLRDFLILTISAFVILSINVFQNYKTEESLKKLKSLTTAYTEVIREGLKRKIETKYLVEGDFVIVNEGDRIPADLLIIESSNLLIDEAILTGESLPIQKKVISDLNLKKFEDSYIAFSGTLILSGWLIGVVYKTGLKTKIGEIGKTLELLSDEEPQVKKEINKIVSNLAIICAITCGFIFTYNLIKTYDFTQSTIYAISLAVALVPEELPIVLTIFLALSSLRLSKNGLIIKNKAIVETLGATNIICVDKTGTITKNNLRLKKIILNNEELEVENLELAEKTKDLLESAYLATYFNTKDTADLEIIKLFEKTGIEIPKMQIIEEGVIAKKFVYSKKYLYRKQYYTYAKGAYESISKICRIQEKYEDFYLSKIEELTKVGYRIIAVANKKETKEDGTKKFEFLGLLAYQDEIREDVKEYIQICQENSIRVCMITGDYKNTAIYFAKEIGLNNYDKVITGDELENLPDEKLKIKIQNSNVFARITPQQKLKIVKFLKSEKNIVAMTGDGVNDVLALKSANVGISIGEGGSDVAKEASDVILMENNLKNIVTAVSEGRRIYNNLAVTGRYIYSFHIPIVLIAIFNTLLGLPMLLLPVHIAILEFIIDPFSTLVFESIPAKRNILKDAPRRGKFKLLQNLNLRLGTFYGVLMFLLIFVSYFILFKNNVENYQNISLLNLLALNILLIWFNFTANQSFKDLIENKTFLYSILILFLVLVSGIILFKIDLIGILVIASCSLLFSMFSYFARTNS